MLTFRERKKAIKGGPGSGNFSHAGRPGKRGGSAPNNTSGVASPSREKLLNRLNELGLDYTPMQSYSPSEKALAFTISLVEKSQEITKKYEPRLTQLKNSFEETQAKMKQFEKDNEQNLARAKELDGLYFWLLEVQSGSKEGSFNVGTTVYHSKEYTDNEKIENLMEWADNEARSLTSGFFVISHELIDLEQEIKKVQSSQVDEVSNALAGYRDLFEYDNPEKRLGRKVSARRALEKEREEQLERLDTIRNNSSYQEGKKALDWLDNPELKDSDTLQAFNRTWNAGSEQLREVAVDSMGPAKKLEERLTGRVAIIENELESLADVDTSIKGEPVFILSNLTEYTASQQSTEKVKRNVNTALDILSGFDVFEKEIGLNIITTAGGRASVTIDTVSGQDYLKLSGFDSLPVVIHEVTHAIEKRIPEISDVSNAFLIERAAGAKVRKLSDITGKKYDDREIAVEPAKPFFNPYVGKVYKDTGTNEVLSMGVERLFSAHMNNNMVDLYNFAKGDINHFLLSYDFLKNPQHFKTSQPPKMSPFFTMLQAGDTVLPFDLMTIKGGPGSGNWSHVGRPGKRGGSGTGGGLSSNPRKLGQYREAAGTLATHKKAKELRNSSKEVRQKTSLMKKLKKLGVNFSEMSTFTPSIEAMQYAVSIMSQNAPGKRPRPFPSQYHDALTQATRELENSPNDPTLIAKVKEANNLIEISINAKMNRSKRAPLLGLSSLSPQVVQNLALKKEAESLQKSVEITDSFLEWVNQVKRGENNIANSHLVVADESGGTFEVTRQTIEMSTPERIQQGIAFYGLQAKEKHKKLTSQLSQIGEIEGDITSYFEKVEVDRYVSPQNAEKAKETAYEVLGTITANLKLPFTPRLKITSIDRASHGEIGNEINISPNTSKSSIAHELGHALETAFPSLKKRSQAFLYERANGQPIKQLNQITQRSYNENELALVPKEPFIDPYVGKLYEHGSTEVISMGLGELFTIYSDPSPKSVLYDLQQFIRKDFNHFAYTHDVLRGHIDLEKEHDFSVKPPTVFTVGQIAENFVTLPAIKGGPGSGNYNHAGRPGKRGGSAPDNNMLSTLKNLGVTYNNLASYSASEQTLSTVVSFFTKLNALEQTAEGKELKSKKEQLDILEKKVSDYYDENTLEAYKLEAWTKEIKDGKITTGIDLLGQHFSPSHVKEAYNLSQSIQDDFYEKSLAMRDDIGFSELESEVDYLESSLDQQKRAVFEQTFLSSSNNAPVFFLTDNERNSFDMSQKVKSLQALEKRISELEKKGGYNLELEDLGGERSELEYTIERYGLSTNSTKNGVYIHLNGKFTEKEERDIRNIVSILSKGSAETAKNSFLVEFGHTVQNDRGFFIPDKKKGGGVIKLPPNSGYEVITHEFSHALEKLNPELEKVGLAILLEKTKENVVLGIPDRNDTNRWVLPIQGSMVNEYAHSVTIRGQIEVLTTGVEALVNFSREKGGVDSFVKLLKEDATQMFFALDAINNPKHLIEEAKKIAIDYSVFVNLQEGVNTTQLKNGLKTMATKGGPGSGNFNHAGRPGKRGGSSAGKGVYKGSKEARQALKAIQSFVGLYNDLKKNDYAQIINVQKTRLELANQLEEMTGNEPDYQTRLNEALALSSQLEQQKDAFNQKQQEVFRGAIEAIKLPLSKQTKITPQQIATYSSEDDFLDTSLEKRNEVREIAAQIGQFISRDVWPITPFKVELNQGNTRAKLEGTTVVINENNLSAKTFAHELGHFLEINNPRVKEKILSFYEQRTNGLEETQLSQYSQGYGDNEITIRDSFAHAYMGKRYTDNGKQTHTEILSMGLEMFFTNGGVGLASNDSEHWLLVYDVLRGNDA